MKTMLFALAALAMSSRAALGQSVSKAKIAELSCHRVERLVILKKIDDTFRTRLEKIDVTQINNGAAMFESVVTQTQPSTGQPMQLQLTFDKDGKPLSFQVVAGGVLGADPQWPTADAVTLAENSLHYVSDNANDPNVKKFNDGFTYMVLTKGTLEGNLVSRDQIFSSDTTDKLNVYLNVDGTFKEADVVP